MIRPCRVRGMLGMLCLMAVARDARPGTAPPAIRLPELEVTALRTGADPQRTPATTYERSAADTQFRQSARTTPDALRGLPSVMVQKTSYGQGSPYLRGFTGFRTLLLVDGIRLNNSVFREGPNQYWNTVDPFSIRSYEVVMGPSSVLYGSDAIGGTVNARTGEAPAEGAWERRVYLRSASAERSVTGRTEISGPVAEHLGFTGGVTLKNYGDLEGGREVGRQKHTGYDEWDYDARMDWTPDTDTRLTLAHQAVNQNDAWRTHKTIYGIDWEGVAAGDDRNHSFDQHRDLTCLKYRADRMNGWWDAVEITLSRQVQSEDQYRVKKDYKSELQGFDVTTWGAAVQFENDTAAGDWVYGVDYYRDAVDSYSRKYKADGAFDKSEIQGPVAADATYDTLGVFAQDTLRVADGALEVIPGVRYTCAAADANAFKDPLSGRARSLTDSWDALTGSLRLLHPFDRDHRQVVFAGVSQGFRAPNLSDLTRLDTARSNEIETPVTDLDSERFTAYEAGVKFRMEKWSWQIAGYHTDVRNMIVRAPTGRIIDGMNEVTKRNAGDGYVRGIETSVRREFTEAVSGWLALSWMDGEVDGYPTSDPVPARGYISRLMPVTSQVGVRWQTSGARWWAEALCDIAARADHLSAEDLRDTQRIPPGGTPGYVVPSVRVGANAIRGVQIVLAVENLFDEDYRIHGSGVNEPGRNFVLSAESRF